MLRQLLGPVVLALVIPTSLAAQSQATTGVIRGTVTDPSRAAVAGATVILRETQTGFQRQLTTNARGMFVAPLMPLGTYDVSARAVGFAEAKRTGIRLGVGETVDLSLALAAVQLQAVVVEATRPVVEATKVENSTRLPDAAVSRLPNNGRNYLNLTLLTPNVAIVQGPDGDELSIGGQKGIHNNVAVDGADFNNPFFGEQRGGQRPPFTFNLDAVQEIVVTSSGATAEFGRSSGGFVNVVTKSGTNELHGSAHYYGKDGALSGVARHGTQSLSPDFTQHQFGFTLGGPIKRDRAFFFVAYDQQIYDETKQTDPNRIAAPLRAWMDTAYAGVLRNDYGTIHRTNDARALLAKLDFRLSDRHNASIKYNYTWSEQANGTFDVDSWARSANGLEQDHSNAVNGSLISYLTPRVANEFRFQLSREDRPRPYDGPRSSALGPDPTGTGNRPFPDVAMDFAGGYRFGMPFFLPIDYYDTRIQLLDNVSFAKGDHFFKAGGEFNRVNSVQTFIGFANSRFIFSSVSGFLNYLTANNSLYVECSNGSSNVTGTCPTGTSVTGPVLLYLQQAGVGRTVREAGTQSIPQKELALYVQDTWKPSAKLTLNYGLRWEAQLEPSILSPRDSTFYSVYYDSTVTNAEGTFRFPSNGTIPSDKKMFQPRIGFTYDPAVDGRQVLRFSAGIFYARIPGLNLASTRSTDGYRGVTLFGSSATATFLPPPTFPNLFPSTVPFSAVAFPSVFVFDRHFRNPRTLSATLGYERQIAGDLGVTLSYTHAKTDHLTRFINRNDPVFGAPWSSGPRALNTLTVVESSAKSNYNGVTVGLKRVLDPNFQFQVNYTLSFDKSDDDNERDPFTFRYVRADNLAPEYNWSDRDQRHRFNGWVIKNIAGVLFLNSRVSLYSAQPTSESCGPWAGNPLAPPKGARAAAPIDRTCADGSILKRNTLRRDNAFASWDLGVTWPFNVAKGRVELIAQMFNVLGAENFRDPAATSLLFNFDGTLRSGLGDPRQTQIGVHYVW